MSTLTDLATAAGGLLVIGGGVGLVVLFGRDPKADEHDLTDYHETAPVNDAPRSLRRWAEEDRQIAEEMLPAGVEVLPPWDDERGCDACHGDPAKCELLQADDDEIAEAYAANETYTPRHAEILPPAPPGMDAASPLWRQLVVDQVVPTLPDAAVRGIADEWLREIAAEQQARAGVRPVVSPATDRDLTGAFAVVAVA